MSDGRETPGAGGRAFIPVRIAVMTVSDSRILEETGRASSCRS